MSANLPSLSRRSTLAIAVAIFSMHFGAACMLWPTTWGRNSGDSFPLAFAGFFFSGIILPWLGYVAVSKAGTNLAGMTRRVSKTFCYVYGTLTVLVLGPLFAVPRMSAASWDAVAKLFSLDPASSQGYIVLHVGFSVLFYLVTAWFMSSQTNILGKLAKYLAPLLLMLEIGIILTAVFLPLGEAVSKNYPEHPFNYGFINGYQTLDLICAIMFSGFIIYDLRNRLGGHAGKVNRCLCLTGLLGFLLMALIQFGEMYRGSTASGIFPTVDYAKLSATLIIEQFGITGGTIFDLCLLLTCLTTAVGLLAGTATFVAEASDKRISYGRASAFCLAVSFAISCAGLDVIVNRLTPVLQFVYPPCIALTLCYVFASARENSTRLACILTAIWGFLDMTAAYLLMAGFPGLNEMLNMVPLSGWGLAFVWPMALGWRLGMPADSRKLRPMECKKEEKPLSEPLPHMGDAA